MPILVFTTNFDMSENQGHRWAMITFSMEGEENPPGVELVFNDVDRR